MFAMIAKMKNRKNKGFTLVELIVVLIILGILAALLLPTLTSYIDKAHEESAVAECRMGVMAAKTVMAEVYEENYPTPLDGDTDLTDRADEFKGLSEYKAGVTFYVAYAADGTVLKAAYSNGVYKCVYNGDGYETEKTDNDAAEGDVSDATGNAGTAILFGTAAVVE